MSCKEKRSLSQEKTFPVPGRRKQIKNGDFKRRETVLKIESQEGRSPSYKTFPFPVLMMD